MSVMANMPIVDLSGPEPTDDVLTITEAAAFLKISDQHVRRLAEAGELPGRKLGDRWRFSRTALLRYLEGNAS